MSKTYKDRPGKYKKEEYHKPKEKRFIKSKGREKQKQREELDVSGY